MHNDAHLLFPHSEMQAMSNQQVTALATEQISLKYNYFLSQKERTKWGLRLDTQSPAL